MYYKTVSVYLRFAWPYNVTDTEKIKSVTSYNNINTLFMKDYLSCRVKTFINEFDHTSLIL